MVDIVSNLWRSRFWANVPSTVEYPAKVANDFFGINIAASVDPECDTYIIDRLRELSIGQVRMDFSYCSPGGDAERMLERVLTEGFDVLLDIFPPSEEAAILHRDESARLRWRDFIAEVFDSYADRVSIFEIGSTPNRSRWSGFHSRSYIVAWEIACELADSRSLKLAGPNISDFEPLYNIGYLSAMQRAFKRPVIHTDNLFVERVIEPEQNDHRVFGQLLKNRLKFNLLKKARVIDAIGRQFNAVATYCTYKMWTTKRLKRYGANWEQKRADYLVRYLILIATSGAVERVYWGPLICNRDGLIDCGDDGYPVIDNVSFYREIRGQLSDFVIRPAFLALGLVARELPQSECIQGISADNGLSHFVFRTADQREFHVCWCRDRRQLDLNVLYPKDSLTAAQLLNNTGQPLEIPPLAITEQPLFINWEAGAVAHRPDRETIETADIDQEIRYPVVEGCQNQTVVDDKWQGVVTVRDGADIKSCLADLTPDALAAKPEISVLRDKRNRLWTISSDLYPEQPLVVKLNRARGIKKFTYRFLQSKGLRHWNNASEMLRRGISTPRPVAYFEQAINSGTSDNYYVCEFVADAFSARNVFTSIQEGNDSFRGFTKVDLIDRIAKFIYDFHSRGIIHRDLSSGNLMMKIDDEGNLKMFLTDIGRAKIFELDRPSARECLLDLMRICYKLSWSDRELFIASYNEARGEVLTHWWRIPLYYYEYKQKTKKTIRNWAKTLVGDANKIIKY
ncbi:MAG TPA: hypothetical protein DCM64_00175 [Gammaproteobacteria bacterium]|nr:hypothetical protein [Gammaproteobacteria bacterium]